MNNMYPGKAFYEKYAQSYPDDLVIRGSQLAFIKKNLHYKGKVGLDIGSANGALVFELATNGAKEVHGIDIANEFIIESTKKAKKRKIGNTTFKQADALKLPYKDNTFDFIVCCEVLEHVPNFRQAIDEIQRVLKKGGEFIITVPNTLCPAEMAHQMKHGIMYVLKKEPITHINLFFMPTARKYFKWARELTVQPLHFVLPFFPKKYVKSYLIKTDLNVGSLLKPIAFDIVLKGKK